VYTGGLNGINELLKSKNKIVNTINPHSYVIAKTDCDFKESLQTSDVLIPDGIGIVFAFNQIKQKKINKISGADLHEHMLKILNSTHGSVFYMGSSIDTLKKVQEKLLSEFPNISVGTHSPPYKSELSDKDSELILEKINKFNPDVLFVSMTAPKQEKWLHKYKHKLNFKVASSIGAVFDFYAGTIERPTNFWIDAHLEWLVRLVQNPKRLWRRSFVSAPLFLIDMLLYKFHIKK
jgi:N-acetylglucosaminyldiphosphoundecaprenol N-acetyl-beta-D-mannosaminyltransferase